MYRLTMKIVCLTIMMAGMCSCSTGNDEDKSDPFVPKIEPTSSLLQSDGKYTGVWWMNDVKTEADNIFYLHNEKISQKPGVIDYNKNVNPSYVDLHYNSMKSTFYIEFYEFPFKAIARELFPDIEIAYLTIETQEGAPFDPEEKLYSNIRIEAGNSICLFYSMPLEIIGYSENAVYNNFHPIVGMAYLRMPYVVTTKDGNYFGMVLDIVPDKSTVSQDIASGTISCNILIRQIEIYDKDMQKSVRSLDQDIKLTFISTEKKSE
ncbi:MAG: hypothetical protein J5658_13755 [Prevotella sp.]|nr:hypothetical protein [Prevotella sp.]